jgi:hypothetical protein
MSPVRARYVELASAMPVLDAIRLLAAAKQSASVASVASTAGVPRRQVLEVLAANQPLFEMRGRSIVLGPVVWHSEQAAFAAGAVFRSSKIGYGSATELEFSGHDELRAQLSTTRTFGGLGDCYDQTFVEDTAEHRAALVADGLVDIADPSWLERFFAWREG